MPKLRYGLHEQLHFRGSVAGRPDVIITIQRWDAFNAAARRSICVITHDGAEAMRKLCVSAEDLALLDGMLTETRRRHAADILSTDAAHDEVARRGGPGPRWCGKDDCGAMIPFASPQCAEGCPVDSVGGVEFLSVTQRSPVLTVVTGGNR